MNERAYERAVKELTRAKKALLAAKRVLEKDGYIRVSQKPK